MLNAVSKERVGEILKTQLNLPSYDITKFDYSDEKGPLPVLNEMLELTANNFCTISGKRLFITPNILNKTFSKITDAATRKFDIKLPAAFTNIDSVEINMPAGYVPESIPANISLNTKFGSYNASSKVSPGKIIYVRNLQRNHGRYPPADAVALADFFLRIYNADRARVVLIKEESK